VGTSTKNYKVFLDSYYAWLNQSNKKELSLQCITDCR
jgi:hypothetical protein